MKKVFYFFALVLASSNLFGVDSEGFVDDAYGLGVDDGGGVDLAPALRQVFLDDLNKKKEELESRFLKLRQIEEERQSEAKKMQNEVDLLEGQVELLRKAAVDRGASQDSDRPKVFMQENRGLKEMASGLEGELEVLKQKRSNFLANTRPGPDATKLGFDLLDVEKSMDGVNRLSDDDVMKYNYFVRNFAGAKEHADLEYEGSRLKREYDSLADPNSLQGQASGTNRVFRGEAEDLAVKITENADKVKAAEDRYRQNLAAARRMDFEKVPGREAPVELKRARAKFRWDNAIRTVRQSKKLSRP